MVSKIFSRFSNKIFPTVLPIHYGSSTNWFHSPEEERSCSFPRLLFLYYSKVFQNLYLSIKKLKRAYYFLKYAEKQPKKAKFIEFILLKYLTFSQKSNIIGCDVLGK